MTRATLHNVSTLRRHGLRKGDRVELVRRGGVIPHVERVISASDQPLELPPLHCPSCGGATTLVERRDDKTGETVAVLYCTQPDRCTAAKAKQLLHFCQTLEMEGFGDKVIEILTERGLVAEPADLFTLQVGDLLSLPRFGEATAANLLGQVRQARRVSLVAFLTALGIAALGKQTARLLASRGDLAAIRAMGADEIAKFHSLGDKTGAAIASGLAERAGLIDRLLAHIEVEAEARHTQQGRLSGHQVLFTGALTSMKRGDAQKWVVARGGLTGDTVTAETTLLVVGGDELNEAVPSSKLKKGRKLQEQGSSIEILSEAQFFARYGAT